MSGWASVMVIDTVFVSHNLLTIPRLPIRTFDILKHALARAWRR